MAVVREILHVLVPLLETGVLGRAHSLVFLSAGGGSRGRGLTSKVLLLCAYVLMVGSAALGTDSLNVAAEASLVALVLLRGNVQLVAKHLQVVAFDKI